MGAIEATHNPDKDLTTFKVVGQMSEVAYQTFSNIEEAKAWLGV